MTTAEAEYIVSAVRKTIVMYADVENYIFFMTSQIARGTNALPIQLVVSKRKLSVAYRC